MKNTFLFWLLITVPLAGVFLLMKYAHNYNWLIALFVYILFYRTITDALRLRALGKLKGKDSWKLFIPFYRLKHFRALYGR